MSRNPIKPQNFYNYFNIFLYLNKMSTERVRLATLCSDEYGGTLQILPDSKLSYLEQDGT